MRGSDVVFAGPDAGMAMEPDALSNRWCELHRQDLNPSAEVGRTGFGTPPALVGATGRELLGRRVAPAVHGAARS